MGLQKSHPRVRQEQVVAAIGVRRDLRRRETGNSGRRKMDPSHYRIFLILLLCFYPTRIGPSQEDSHTGHQRGESGNTRDDGTPNRLPRDPKSGYLVRDLSQLQTSRALILQHISFHYTLLVVCSIQISDSRDMP